MTYEDKVSYAHRLIEQSLAEFGNPCIACSFGKDSMVVLDLVRRHRDDLPVVFHREPWQPHKYRFADAVIQHYGLRVYDFPPSATMVQDGGGEVEIAGYYQIGARYNMLPTGIRAPKDGEDFVCGLADIYQRPTGTFNWPWDAMFHGHKASDTDAVYGDITIRTDVARNLDSASLVFPIRLFTDEDVWRYIEENNLPIHHGRYEKVGESWQEREDKGDNPDYVTACTACMAKDGPAEVLCPRLGQLVSNVSDQLRWSQKERPSYLRAEAA
jgi:3'-phosphoadenosine 5'-phosphosulfate sulfotransferase (PAPS reductase)/FAD synthetase